jgi:hypothetical protein
MYLKTRRRQEEENRRQRDRRRCMHKIYKERISRGLAFIADCSLGRSSSARAFTHLTCALDERNYTRVQVRERACVHAYVCAYASENTSMLACVWNRSTREACWCSRLFSCSQFLCLSHWFRPTSCRFYHVAWTRALSALESRATTTGRTQPQLQSETRRQSGRIRTRSSTRAFAFRHALFQKTVRALSVFGVAAKHRLLWRVNKEGRCTRATQLSAPEPWV